MRGEADVYISLSGKTSPKDWDMAAPHALIEAAGGMFSHADGKHLVYQETNYSQSGCLIASHGKSHQKICQKAMDFFSMEEPKYFVYLLSKRGNRSRSWLRVIAHSTILRDSSQS